MNRGKAFTAQRHKVEIGQHTFILVKGDSRYSRWYVLDEDGNYLTHKGAGTYDGAMLDGAEIAKQRDAEASA